MYYQQCWGSHLRSRPAEYLVHVESVATGVVWGQYLCARHTRKAERKGRVRNKVSYPFRSQRG